ncbi:MAG TPA: hypothetical protein VGO09_01265 [Flavisolibacter sp.]|nr:hypothetical protein [Flavisolibacter sp.]
MKIIILSVCLFFGCSLSAQVVSGLFTGKLVNDSTKKVQTYELALSEYRGKITGYSYTTFVRNDSFFYSIKRLKATKKDGQLIVEDVEMIVNNFPEPPAKHVHQINKIQLPNEDTMRQATGTWETNKTKIYYSIHGGVAMRRDNDSSRSALIGHLKELNIIRQEDRHIDNTTVAIKETKVKEKVVSEDKTLKTKIKETPPDNSVAKVTVKEKEKKTEDKIVQAPVKEEKIKVKPEPEKKDVAIVAVKEKEVIKEKQTKKEIAAPPVITDLPFEQRRNHLMQTLEVNSDSLILAFYDNGVVDGDSISVYVNGINIISHNKLLAVATKKTINISNLGDQIEILLVADNLGTIPPNTGLVVVHDGDNQYQVNFTADLQTNASIIFKRHKK